MPIFDHKPPDYYGPPGGKDVYCLKECQPVNGGTVTKHASAWFWVRLNPPRKVWEKCMEYQSEDENGDSVWYKLVGDRNIPIKVSDRTISMCNMKYEIAKEMRAGYGYNKTLTPPYRLTVQYQVRNSKT